MKEITRRDPRQTAGFGDGINLAMPTTATKKISDTVPVGVRISKELWQEIQQKADQLQVKPARLMAYGLRYFIDQVKKDPDILQFETKRELPKR
jgi:hypothetical protein